jgi:hypothetical protein
MYRYPGSKKERASQHEYSVTKKEKNDLFSPRLASS